jgi:hypothetical protein
MKIRELVSKQFGLRIEEGQWDNMFKSLDAMGKFNLRTVSDMLLAICKYLEQQENERK